MEDPEQLFDNIDDLVSVVSSTYDLRMDPWVDNWYVGFTVCVALALFIYTMWSTWRISRADHEQALKYVLVARVGQYYDVLDQEKEKCERQTS